MSPVCAIQGISATTSIGNGTPQVAAEVLTSYFDFSSYDQEQWWQDTGCMFARLLAATGYDIHAQYRYLLFFIKHLLPALGPYPLRWRSTITPTGLPIEYSLNFQKHGRPLARIGFEPLSYLSGSIKDPYNKISVGDMLSQLAKVRLNNFDNQIFNHFLNDFELSRKEEDALQTEGGISGKGTVRSLGAFGFDLKDGEVAVKGYVFCGLKNRATGTPVGELISDSVRKLESKMRCWDSFSILNEYMDEDDAWNEYTFISWDCVDTTHSRLKFYGVHKAVSWQRIKDMWTLGGRIANSPTNRTGLELLERMWSLLQITEGDRHYQGGFANDYGGKTSPIIWNYELNRGNPHPVPKFYFPVHGENDLRVTDSITEFFISLGWEDHAREYLDLLRKI